MSIVLVGLSACGGGGGSKDDESPEPSAKTVSGGGVKGPLANAIVTAYAFDSTQTGYKGAVVTTATTNASAAITGLALPFPLAPPYILEFTSDAATVDITTGAAPVITTMRTVMTQSLLDSGEQIYATPLTTMAVDIAIANAADTNGTAGIQADEFEAALAVAASQVVSTLGFGLDSSVDIFDTPPLVDASTSDTDTQTQVAAYRSAVEAVTAVAYQINQQAGAGDTDGVLAELAADLADGGGIDGSAGSAINTNTLQVLNQDPASLPIPNSPTSQTVGDVQAILISEKATTGSTTSTAELEPTGSIKTAPAPPQTNPDLDGDGVLNADDAYPNDATADTDSDGDGAPDVAYTDAGRSTVDTARSDADDDNDGWADSLDDYPLDSTRFLDPALDRDSDTVANGSDNCPLISNSDQTDTDGNGRGDACSNDNDGDGVIDTADNCPLIANPGQEDLDGDEVPGTGGGDVCDDDIDGDTVLNDDDVFAFNAGETVDTDGDGIGNNGDIDDDNDGVEDGSDTGVAPAGAPSVGTACSLLRDCDGDGVFDGADYDPVDAAVTFNFAPIVVGSSVVTDEDQAADATLSATDDGVAAGALTYNILTGPNNGTLSGTAPNFTYTPAADFSGPDSFTFNAVDAAGAQSATATVNITVNSVNDAPAIAQTGPLAVNMDEDGSPTAFAAPTITATDAEAETLTWSLGSPAANGTATVSGTGASPTVGYTPNAEYSGSDSFDVSVSDGTSTVSITVDLTIASVDDAPAIAQSGPLAVTMDEDGSPTAFVAPTIGATDVEGDTLTWSLGSPAANGTATVSGTGASPTVGYTPNADFNGSDSFDVSVSDATNTVSITINVTVASVNDAPVIDQTGPLAVSMDEDGSPTAFAAPTISATDTEGETLTWSLGSPAANGTATVSGTGASPTVGYAPNANFNGSDSFDVSVSDGTSTVSITLDVTVNSVNDVPVANDDSVSVLPDGSVLIPVLDNDTDVENSVLTPTFGTADFGTVTNNGDGRASFDATGLTDGTVATFTYTVNDGAADSNTATVTVSVTNNQAPVITQTGPLAVTMDEDGSPTAFAAPTITATDAEGDSLTWSLGSPASNGTATVSGTGASPTVGYTPNADFNGSDSFDVSVSDGTSTVSITIDVTVDPVNDTPVIDQAGPLAVTMDEDGSPTAFAAPTISATDAEGDTLTWSLASAASNGTATVSGTGASPTVGYTPNADFNGSDSFDVSVSDATGTVSITVDVTVNPVNDDPVAVTDSDTVVQNSLVIVSVLGNDTDIEGDTLSVAAGDPVDAVNGIVTNNNDGTFDYVPNTDYIGPDSFTYTVNDGNGGSAVGTVNITVTPLGTEATVADLLDQTNGGGVGYVESWDGGVLPEFDYWKDLYDATAGTITFVDFEYDYETQAFVDDSGFDGYWLTSGGTWELPSGIDVVTPNDGDGSMVVAIRDAADTENVASFRIRAFTQDIAGNLMSNYLDDNWSAQLLNPAATFGAGAQLVTSYSFEALTDAYSFELEDWCEFGDPTRWAALSNSCNGVYINTTSSYATSLAELQVATAWTDTDTTDDSGLVAASVSFDEFGNSELLAEMVVAGNVVNFYVRDYDLTGADYIVKLAETSSWSLDTVSSVMMIRFTIPASLQTQFPELGEEGGLYPFFAEFGGFVRGGTLEPIGSGFADTNILNGIAVDEVLANFDAPAAPDLTDLIGTWVSDNVSFSNGDPTVFHYFASTHYEVSGTCDNDGSIGLEYGTMNVNVSDGTFTTSTSVNGRGSCSLANVAGPGTTLSVDGDTLTLDISGQVTTFSRLKGDLSPLAGSWLAGDIAVGGDGGHVLLTFFADGSYMHSEDCSVDGIGTEYGSYTWDEGNTEQVTTSQVYDANGINPGCGLSENTVGDWELSVVGDTLTVTVPAEGNATFDFTRHSPALVPITPPIVFTEPGATTLYNVELDDNTGDWVKQDLVFNGAGGVTVDAGGPGEDAGTYEIIGGILEITASDGIPDYIMIMSADAASGADRVCWTDPYVELENCRQPGSAFLFDNQTAADTFLADRIAGATFSGSAVDASAVFAASSLYMIELDSYYDGNIDDWVDELLFWEITADGTNATDDEYVLDNGNWVLMTDYYDIALTSTGWKANVDWRLDTSAFANPAVTLSNDEAGETLQSLTVTFSEMAIDGDAVFDYVDPELAVNLVNGTFGAGAKVYESTVTFNNDYYYINDWGTDCDDGAGGNYNGNCNVAQQRTLNTSTGELSNFGVATDTSFLNTATETIELGWNGGASLVAVFASGGVLEFWEVNWSVSSIATESIYSGSWSQDDGLTGSGETLVYYQIPQELSNVYQIQGDSDSPAVFLSQQNGYMRFGELEDEVGPLPEPVYFFNQTALEDINANIPGTPTLP